MTASHSRTMLVEGRECSDVFRTFKHKVVGYSVYPNCVDNHCCLSYNRYLLDIVEHVACTIFEALLVPSTCKWVDIEVAVLIVQKDALVACSTIQSLVTLMVDLFSNQCYNKIQGQFNVL
jgi:hypothetical protein